LLDVLTGLDAEDGAELFHGTLAAAMADWVAAAAEASDIRRVALSGGCFLNSVLVGVLTEELGRRGIEPLQAVRLKPGDSAVSLGQAWAVAMARR
jgi:hydrogenase maturation protein HypF